jgi:hypothetical protein
MCHLNLDYEHCRAIWSIISQISNHVSKHINLSIHTSCTLRRQVYSIFIRGRQDSKVEVAKLISLAVLNAQTPPWQVQWHRIIKGPQDPLSRLNVNPEPKSASLHTIQSVQNQTHQSHPCFLRHLLKTRKMYTASVQRAWRTTR